jgi:hypothetical protein
MTGEFVAAQLGNYFLPFALVGIVGLIGVASIRAGEVVLGFLNVPLMGLSPVFVKRGTIIYANAPETLPRHAAAVAGAGGVLSAIYICGILLAPTRLGIVLLGASWFGARKVMLGLGVAAVAQWVLWAGTNGLHVRSDMRLSFRITAAAAVVTLVASVAGAIVAGTGGAVWGMAVGPCAMIGVAWRMLIVRSRPAVLEEEGAISAV